jgi:hypothetical protein
VDWRFVFERIGRVLFYVGGFVDMIGKDMIGWCRVRTL